VTQASDFVPRGLPDHLPDGERVLWQGQPNWKRLAINAFHVRKVLAYFGIVALAQVVVIRSSGETLSTAITNVPLLVACALAASGILAGLAYLSAKSTWYTLTNKRIMMKVGIALPAYVNMPLHQIDGASFAETGGGCGTVCFRSNGSVRLAYILLWPHAKPWTFSKPQPAFRDVDDGEAVARRVADVLGGAMPERAYNVAPGMIAAE
jgi:hypothetical protein